MNVFKRLGALCINFNFINDTIISEKSLKPSFKFWFFWNLIFSFVLGIGLFFAASFVLEKIQVELLSSLPDFEATIKSGKLSTNLIEPIVLENEKLAFILDTQSISYTSDALNTLGTSIFIEEDRLYFKSEAAADPLVYEFELLQDKVISKQGLIESFVTQKTVWALAIGFVGTIVIYFLLSVATLPMVLFFALLFWGIARVFAIRTFDLKVSFASILSYYILFNLLQILLALGGFSPVLGLVVMLVLVGINLYKVRKREYEL